MSKSKESKLVPKLRFPEFNETWETEQLFKLLDYERPDNYIVKDTKYTSEGIPVLTANKSFVIGYTNESFGICKNIPAIIFDDFTTDKKYVDFPFKVKSSAIKILRTKDINNLKFIFELMTLIRFEAKEHKRYYISEYQTLFVLIPKYKEQKKIADCLSSLDDVITAESKKLEALKEHKKGLLQNLFPQEGEKVPKLRFKEFKNCGEWKIKKLDDVAEIITGNTPSTHEPDYYGGERMFVSPADIDDKRYITQTKTTLTELGFAKTRTIRPNSILFVCIGSTIGKIAQNKYECATNQQINSLLPYDEYSSDFIYSLLEAYSNKIALLAGKQAVPIINKTLFSSVSLLFPEISEQQKIASLLLSLDESITAQIQKVESLKLHKKGLLQGLFPNINGVNE